MPVPGPLVLGNSPGPQFPSGRQLPDGDDLNKISGNMFSAESGLTAGAGGTRAAAYPIKASKSQFTVVATANDGCVLPVAYPGLDITILNSDAADSLQVFANGSDTINATAGATGVALAAGACARFVCVVTGNWRRFVSA
jgi:hypothetical protein